MRTRIRTGRVNAKYTGDNWYDGTVDGYRFQAKAFNEPSRFGINPEKPEEVGFSTVSKLCIWDGKTVIYNYDRGFDEGTEQGKGLVARVVEAFK